MISFIVPAHNEAAEIEGTLHSIFESARKVGKPFEVIVVDDASTDQTAALATSAGARVVDVQYRKISAVRNAGARQSKGEFLFFVDADTSISEQVLREALRALREGAVGGGAWVKFAQPASVLARGSLHIFGFIYGGILRWAAGCFIYARKNAFEAAGGFDETLYASEEVALSMALKRQGRFVIGRAHVTTSARKFRLHSLWVIVQLGLRFLRYGSATLRDPKGLDWWYDGKREKPGPARRQS